MAEEKRITHEYALEKAKEIVGKMTLQERAEQLTYKSASIKRLGIPRYNWWNEGLHGVARAGTATVFPQAIGLAAMFDDELLHEIAEVISTEGRAKYNESSKKDDRDIYKGITFWSIVGKKDLYETYLPAFEACVKEGDVEAVMGAYNRTNGEPCCGSKTLLKDILRGKWNFKGHVVSDCWAIADFHLHHNVTSTATESAALAIKNGCDLNCGNIYLQILLAYKEGLVTEEDITTAAERLMATRIRLGMFDEECEYNKIPYELNDCKKHNELSLKAARKSMVLLRNNGILPLNKEKLKAIAVIGPNADSKIMLKGNYSGTASRYITVLDGIHEAVQDDVRVYYSEGCHLYKDRVEELAEQDDRLAEAISIAERSDVAILCLGLDSTIEGEQGDAGNSEGAGDKPNLNLPRKQQELLEKIIETGTPVILVIGTGSALTFNGAEEKCAAILDAWYPGSRGGRAISIWIWINLFYCRIIRVKCIKY